MQNQISIWVVIVIRGHGIVHLCIKKLSQRHSNMIQLFFRQLQAVPAPTAYGLLPFRNSYNGKAGTPHLSRRLLPHPDLLPHNMPYRILMMHMHISLSHSTFLIRSMHSSIVFLGAATLILWNPVPVFPKIFPLSSQSFAS